VDADRSYGSFSGFGGGPLSLSAAKPASIKRTSIYLTPYKSRIQPLWFSTEAPSFIHFGSWASNILRLQAGAGAIPSTLSIFQESSGS
jgi:hypothetical protein